MFEGEEENGFGIFCPAHESRAMAGQNLPLNSRQLMRIET